MMKKVLIYSNELSTSEYTADHPFKPVRAKLFMELLHRYLLIYEDNQIVIPPRPIEEELIGLFHDRTYIDLLKTAGNGGFSEEMLHAGLGTGDNPVFLGMYELSRLIAGGTFYGAEMVASGEADVVFNPIGGMHHAGRDHASGFCYLNDIAITITDLVRKGMRIAYIDIDVHHGNGVQDAFYETDQVLTISLHESGESLYPGCGYEHETGAGLGRGFTVNIPLREGTDDEVYLFAFESIVPPLIEKFQPDMVFAELGGDGHKDDPLAHLNLTTNGYERVVKRIRENSPKLMATGGGGYNVYRTAAMWTLAWAAMCGLTPIDQYVGSVGGMMYGPEMHMGRLNDEPFVLEGPEKDACLSHARRVVGYLMEKVFPIHGL